MGSVVVLLEDWARKWLRRMLLTSGSFSSNKHKATKLTKSLFEGSGKNKYRTLQTLEYLKVFLRGEIMPL